MCNKSLPLSLPGSGDQGSFESNGILPPECSFVKPISDESFEKYRISVFNGYFLQVYARKLVHEIFPFRDNINYCKCGIIPVSAFVSVFRHSEFRRASFNGVVTCANPFLCPVCAPRIMGRRSSEIKQAVHQWLSESEENTCYLLTLTFRHSINDSLRSMFSNMKMALKSFWSDRSIKAMFSDAGRIGRVTAFEITFSSVSGWHPHEHILIFCKKFNFDHSVLNERWKNALKRSKLSGLSGIALDLIEARSCDKYLQKISAEMALSNCKQGRGSGSFSPFQLLAAYADGQSWAGDRFKELFKVYSQSHLHPLQWSRGLKSRFGIVDVSDSDIVENRVDPLVLWSMIPSPIYRKLSAYDKAFLRICAAIGDKDRFVLYFSRIVARVGG